MCTLFLCWFSGKTKKFFHFLSVDLIFFIKTSSTGAQTVARLVEALCYKPEGLRLSLIFFIDIILPTLKW